MAITSYPRVTLQGSGPSQNPQNGTGLMVLNPSTNKYEAVTASTFSGGGGGDATAANQTTQIDQGTETNGFLQAIQDYLIYDGNPIAQLLYSNTASKSNADLLNDINTTLGLINAELISLNSALTDGSARVVIQDTSGDTVLVNSSGQLEVKTN